ncbi:MAG: hypothetical protein ACI306_04105 [Muribaculaceae bacterium]
MKDVKRHTIIPIILSVVVLLMSACTNTGVKDYEDIRMEFDKYNERHATQARWEASPGSYGEAINKLL